MVSELVGSQIPWRLRSSLQYTEKGIKDSHSQHICAYDLMPLGEFAGVNEEDSVKCRLKGAKTGTNPSAYR